MRKTPKQLSVAFYGTWVCLEWQHSDRRPQTGLDSAWSWELLVPLDQGVTGVLTFSRPFYARKSTYSHLLLSPSPFNSFLLTIYLVWPLQLHRLNHFWCEKYFIFSQVHKNECISIKYYPAGHHGTIHYPAKERVILALKVPPSFVPFGSIISLF